MLVESLLTMVVFTYNHSALEDEAKGSLGVLGQSRLHGEFQDNAVRPTKQTKSTKKERKSLGLESFGKQGQENQEFKHPQLHSKFNASLGYETLFQNNMRKSDNHKRKNTPNKQ